MNPSEQANATVPLNGDMGNVQTKYATLFEPPNELEFQAGSKLGPTTVAYETYGTLNERRDNAVFICHALTGDAHAAGYHGTEDDEKPGWWDGFIGPGKGIDTDRYFVICANVLGGCQGTTGPGSINPATGERFCLEFPFLTVSDIVSMHSELVTHLGIRQLLAVVGGSLGGMQVLDWAVRFPNQVLGAIVLASAPKLAAQGIAFNAVGRRAIYADTGFANGRYYDGEGPRYGLSLARMIAHITYLSEDSIELKFGRRLQDSDRFAFDMQKETEFQIESYLHYQGKRFVQRFDANSYLYLTRAMDYFDLAEGSDSLADALKDVKARFLVASYDTDWLFPTAQSKELVSALLRVGKHVSFTELPCPFGHDSFLIDLGPLTEMVAPFLEQTQLAGRTSVDE
ncbi:MAG: homoserine O-acetyltransferase [Fuerstiella sp.]|nr:homoserine O-acetyltransferase [Fuerstiella sp.]MCP4856406.1 homoserine O-acetyltransferase [Fuerstiella sp.]